jgi:regulatory protein
MTYSNSRGKPKRKPIYDESTGVPPTDDQNERMMKQAKNVCYYWLGAAEKTRKQLFDKVKNKGITDDIANQLLDELEENNSISDDRYAENFVYSKLTYEKLGKQAIGFKLRTKGIDQNIIDRVLSEIGDEESEENARILARKRVYPTRNMEKNKRLQNIASFLARRGYGGSLAFKVAKEELAAAALEEATANEDDEQIYEGD